MDIEEYLRRLESRVIETSELQMALTSALGLTMRALRDVDADVADRLAAALIDTGEVTRVNYTADRTWLFRLLSEAASNAAPEPKSGEPAPPYLRLITGIDPPE